MSRVLIIYASHYGQTCAIARRIAARLRERGHDVVVADARLGARRMPTPETYDAVVLGSRVELGRHSADVLEYVRAHRDALLAMPTAFFSVSMAASGSAAGRDPSGYLTATFDELGWYPAQSIALAGGLPYRRYNWLLRFVMKRISRSAGHTTDTSRDHEFTDWSVVVSFADKIGYIAGGAARVERDRPVLQPHTN